MHNLSAVNVERLENVERDFLWTFLGGVYIVLHNSIIDFPKTTRSVLDVVIYKLLLLQESTVIM